jgi:E3 ubiquitin-protein ligase TRIP12
MHLQAHPLACAASLAVQKVIAEENLLENCRKQGVYLRQLLEERLQKPGALAAPFTFDIRGQGGFFGIEFDFTVPQEKKLDFKGEAFAPLVQARCFENGLIIMGAIVALSYFFNELTLLSLGSGFTGCANIEGTLGDHCILAPPYNVTKQEVENIVDLFVRSVEDVLKKFEV